MQSAAEIPCSSVKRSGLSIRDLLAITEQSALPRRLISLHRNGPD